MLAAPYWCKRVAEAHIAVRLVSLLYLACDGASQRVPCHSSSYSWSNCSISATHPACERIATRTLTATLDSSRDSGAPCPAEVTVPCFDGPCLPPVLFHVPKNTSSSASVLYTVATCGVLIERSDNSNGGMLIDATGDGSADDVMMFNSGDANEVFVNGGSGVYSRLTNSVLVERSDNSYSGMLIDATGDGSADDIMVFNSGDANEVFVNGGSGVYSRLTNSVLVERTGRSYGGMLVDATGDGSADDIMVFKRSAANEVFVNGGSGVFSRLTNSVLVERSDNSNGGMLIDATGDGSADDIMVFHFNANEVFVNGGSGVYSRLTNSVLVERLDHWSYGGMLIDATGDGSADDIMVFNGLRNYQANEVFVNGGSGVFSRLTNSALVERTDESHDGMLIDATGDGSADDIMVFNSGDANEVFVNGGSGVYSRLTNSVLVERSDESHSGMLVDATGDGSADDIMVFNIGSTNEMLVNGCSRVHSRLTNSVLVERSDRSYGGMLIDATGDGSVDDIMILNFSPSLNNDATVVLVNGGSGGYSRLLDGVLAQWMGRPTSGMLIDAMGDGSADDIMVFSIGDANEVFVNGGSGVYSRLTNSVLVERLDRASYGGMLIDATGDGSADDIIVFNSGDANEVFV
eukprot:COSAG02_NODE_8330_length_2612_cov_84.701955_1_plen_633_part_10